MALAAIVQFALPHVNLEHITLNLVETKGIEPSTQCLQGIVATISTCAPKFFLKHCQTLFGFVYCAAITPHSHIGGSAWIRTMTSLLAGE